MSKFKPILVHVTASLSLGGAETVLFNLVRGLQPFYHQRVMSVRDGPFAQKIREFGVPVYVATGSPIMRFIRLWYELNRSKPDIIHALLWSTNMVVRLYTYWHKVPVICAIHSPFNANAGNSWVRAVIDRLTARWATKTVFVSPYVLNQALISRALPKEKCLVIPNGISCEDICAAAQREKKTRDELGFDETNFIIGTVGRLVPVKNQKLLIQLVDDMRVHYPQIRLIIVGHGPLQAGLNQLVCERGLSSYVLITQGTGTSYYPLFDCFVQPSFTEGLSMALLEAMFFKVPVLVSSSTGEHDVVCNGKNGYLFKPTDLATLIKHVEHIMQDQILKKQLADRAYEYVHSQYALEHVIKAYRSVLDSLI